MSTTEPLYPKNNWEMVEMLMDGSVCRIRPVHYADVIAALDHHIIRAEVEVIDGWMQVTPIIK